MERRSYIWFEKRRRTKGLELAHEQITKAFDTVTLLHKATKSFAEGNLKEANKHIENLFTAEEEVDKLKNEAKALKERIPQKFLEELETRFLEEDESKPSNEECSTCEEEEFL